MTYGHLLLIGLLIGALSGCGDETSIPQPQPVPSPLRSMIRLSTPTEPAQEDTLVVGLPGAVVGSGKIVIIDNADAELATTPAANVGSFVAQIPTADLAQAKVRYENDDGISDPTPLLREQVRGPPPALEAANVYGPQVVSAPDSSGRVTVSNDAGAGNPPLVSASADSELLVANATSGLVVATTTNAEGIFSVEIAAAIGDEIELLLVSADEPGLTSDFLTYTVPSS